jgi:hypothetical protein
LSLYEGVRARLFNIEQDAHFASGGVRDRLPHTGHPALLVIHNHPSGDPTPSPGDARLTLRLAQAADILDMPLLDHLIVGDAGQRQSPAHPQTTAQVRPRNDGPPIFLAATLYQKSNFRS